MWSAACFFVVAAWTLPLSDARRIRMSRSHHGESPTSASESQDDQAASSLPARSFDSDAEDEWEGDDNVEPLFTPKTNEGHMTDESPLFHRDAFRPSRFGMPGTQEPGETGSRTSSRYSSFSTDIGTDPEDSATADDNGNRDFDLENDDEETESENDSDMSTPAQRKLVHETLSDSDAPTKGQEEDATPRTERSSASAASTVFGLFSFPCSKLQGKYMCGALMKASGANTKLVWQEQVSCAETLCMEHPEHVCCDTLEWVKEKGLLEPKVATPPPRRPNQARSKPSWPPASDVKAQPIPEAGDEPTPDQVGFTSHRKAGPAPVTSMSREVTEASEADGDTDVEWDAPGPPKPTFVVTKETAAAAAESGDCGTEAVFEHDAPGLRKSKYVHQLPPGAQGEEVQKNCGTGLTGTVTWVCSEGRWKVVEDKTSCETAPLCQDAKITVDLNDDLDTSLLVPIGKSAAPGETVSVSCSSAANLAATVVFKGIIEFSCVGSTPPIWAVAKNSCRKSRSRAVAQ